MVTNSHSVSKMTTNPSYKGPFLFVNKTPTNLKSRSGDEAFAISSHVAGSYTKWHKAARVRALQATELAPSTEASKQDGQEDDKTRNFGWLQSIPSATPYAQQHVSSQKNAAALPAPALSSRSLRPLPRRTHCNPLTLLQHGNSDPFSSSSVEITPLNHYLLTTWQSMIMQTLFPSELIQRLPKDQFIHHEGADMISSAERLHFQLAFMLALQLGAMPPSQAKKDLEVKELLHKAEGMKTLRKNLHTISKMTAIRAIWSLMGAEFYGGNSVAVMAHWRALVPLIKSVGGLASLPWDLKKLVVVSDMTISAYSKQKSAFDVVCLPILLYSSSFTQIFGHIGGIPGLICLQDEWDPGSVDSVLSRSEADMLSNALVKEQPLHESIPDRLMDVFISYKELLAVQRLAAVITNNSRLVTVLLWAQMRQYALSTRITNMKAKLSELPASAEIFLETATCVAVDYFLQILWLKNHTQRTTHAPFHHSDGSFEALQGAADLERSPLTLWILFVAATVELILIQRGQKANIFSRNFGKLLQDLRLTTMDDIRNSLSQFLYQKETFDQHLAAFVNPTTPSLASQKISNTQST
jgi:hypothetical protein